MRILLGVLWLLSLVGAYFYGASQPSSQVSVSESPANVSQQGGDNRKGNNTGDTEPARMVNIVSSQAANVTNMAPATELSVDEVLAQTKQLLSGSMQSMSSIAKAYGLVATLNLEQALEGLSLLETGDESTDWPLLQLYLNRVAELSPMQAIDFVNFNMNAGRSQEMALTSVLASWSETDPEAALAWYLTEQKQANIQGMAVYALIDLYGGLAREDFTYAVNSLASNFEKTDYDKIDLAVMGLVRSAKTSDDLEYLFEYVKNSDNQKALHTLFTTWVQKDPQDALLRLDELNDPALADRIENGAFRQWMMKSPDEAVDTFMRRATPEQRQSRAKVVVDALSFANPEKALTWLNDQPDIEADKLTFDLMRQASFRYPQFAADNLHKLANTEQRVKLSAQIYYNFKQYSQSKADEFLAGQPAQVHPEIVAEIKRMEKAFRNR